MPSIVSDADLIGIVRTLRRLTGTLDSIGYPTKTLSSDDELVELIPKNINSKIKDVASEIHSMIQVVENSKRYKEAMKQLCGIKVRE